MYINTGATNVEVLDNTITRAALRGTLLRAGGVVEGNFYDQNAVGIQVDNTASTVEGNVIMEGDDLPSLPSGVGIDVDFDIPQVDIVNNIIAHDISDYTSNVSGINLNGGTKVANIASNIVYDWRRPVIDDGDGQTTVTGNDLEEFDSHHAVINLRGTAGTYTNNTYFDPSESQSFEIGDDVNNKISYGSWKGQTGDTSKFIGDNAPVPDYSDPNRSMATYAAFIGLPSAQQNFDGWISAQRNQSRANWNTQFTAAAEGQYIRDGFTSQSSTISSSLPRVNVTSSALQTTETGSPVTFTFQRVDGIGNAISTGTMSVNYSVTGTATNGVDYTLSPSTVFFADGQSVATVTVSPIHDKNSDGSFNVEQPETVRLQVTASSANPVTYVPGLRSSATITINDSDGGNTPVTPPGSGGGSNPTPPDDNGGGSGGQSGSPATGTGLTVKYYNNQDLVGSPVYTATATSIGIADTTGSPANTSGVNATHYSAVWTGEIQPPTTGTYTFTISVDADAAVRLFVDDGSDDDTAQINLPEPLSHRMADANDDASVNSSDFAIIAAHFGQTGTYWDTGDFNGDGVTNALDFNALATNYGTQDMRAAKTLTGTVFLEAGAGYTMRLEYSQKVGDSKLDFSWTPPRGSDGAVPTTRLYPGHGAGAISVFAPDMSDSAQASALPDAVSSSGSTGSLFSSTQISNDKDVLG